ncbi:MAG: hypothetical protein FJW38_30630 [Acidobacteria bacterium]|nr:hypothetical protein [Acidobacteriota bacterium]
MPFDPQTYPFAKSASVAPRDRQDFETLKSQIVATFNPFTFLQAILVDEFIHASWELARARKYGAPLSFVNRANRNWDRARKTHGRIQTSQIAAERLLEGEDAGAAQACPLANPFTIAKRGKAKQVFRMEIANGKKALARTKRLL